MLVTQIAVVSTATILDNNLDPNFIDNLQMVEFENLKDFKQELAKHTQNKEELNLNDIDVKFYDLPYFTAALNEDSIDSNANWFCPFFLNR